MSIQPRPARRLNKHRAATEPVVSAPSQSKSTYGLGSKGSESVIGRLLKSKSVDVLAALVLLGGFLGLYITFQGNQDVRRQVETVSADDGSDNGNDDSSGSSSSSRPPSVDEPPDRDIRGYQVEPHQPRFLTIGSINVFARIMHTGRDADGNVGSPTNIHDTSWYTSSSVPNAQSERGSTVITGHIGRDSYNGVFYDLPLVNIGDTVHITLGDGSVVEYQVTGKKVVPVDEMRMGDYLGYVGTDAPQLHLITCVGVYDSEILSFRDRLIVTAEQI